MISSDGHAGSAIPTSACTLVRQARSSSLDHAGRPFTDASLLGAPAILNEDAVDNDEAGGAEGNGFRCVPCIATPDCAMRASDLLVNVAPHSATLARSSDAAGAVCAAVGIRSIATDECERCDALSHAGFSGTGGFANATSAGRGVGVASRRCPVRSPRAAMVRTRFALHRGDCGGRVQVQCAAAHCAEHRQRTAASGREEARHYRQHHHRHHDHRRRRGHLFLPPPHGRAIRGIV